MPEIVLEHPEMVAGLHREFVHAGSDVVEAFTYYAHREKMRIIGKEDLIEPLNRNALAIARQIADESGCLAAGDLSNTNAFYPDADTRREVRAMFAEQVQWIVDAGMDFVDRRDAVVGRGGAAGARGDQAGGPDRGRDPVDPPRAARSARAGRPRTPARGWSRPAPTSSGSTASAARGRCCR